MNLDPEQVGVRRPDANLLQLLELLRRGRDGLVQDGGQVNPDLGGLAELTLRRRLQCAEQASKSVRRGVGQEPDAHQERREAERR